MPKLESNVILYLVFLVTISSLFLFTVSPELSTREASLWNLLLAGTVGSTILIFATRKKKEVGEYFDVPNQQKLFSRLSVGFVWGVLLIVTIGFLMSGISALNNLMGSITFAELGSIGNESVLFATLIQPITETFLVITAMIIISLILRSKKVPYPVITSIVIVSLVFAAFHFAVRGKEAYEYSIGGFISFVSDTKGIGTSAYVGAIPQLVMGFFFLGLAVVYKDFIIPMSAHIVNNTLALFFAPTSVLPDKSLLIIVAFVIAVIFLAAFVKTRLVEISDVNLSNLTA